MSQAVVVFAKVPAPGAVKTRLQPRLSAAEAASVYEASLGDVVEMLGGLDVDLHIDYAHSPGAADYFAATFPGVRTSPQPEGDLGRRMAASCERVFTEGAGSVVVIGSDVPTLPARNVEDALAEVRRCGLVFGPSTDGGYYLVAIDRRAWPAARAVFEDVPWSTSDVLARSIQQAKRAGLSPRLLEPWYDLDEPGDLQRAAQDVVPGSRLARWLERWSERRDAAE